MFSRGKAIDSERGIWDFFQLLEQMLELYEVQRDSDLGYAGEVEFYSQATSRLL